MGPSGWPGAETGASPDPPKEAEPPDPREESAAQRADRNLGELLQELRVAGLGVQVLFGFLLSLPFTARFARLSAGQRDLYLASLVLSAVATALLVGPVAYHRLVFRQGQKERLVRAASMMAIGGLAAVALAVSVAVLLVTSFVSGGAAAGLITAFVAAMFGLLWFAFPLARRRLRRLGRGHRRRAARPAHLQPRWRQRHLPRRVGVRDAGQQHPRRLLTHRVRLRDPAADTISRPR